MTPSRDELVKRLKEISEDKTEYEMSFGAMCYSPSIEPILKFKCDSCGKIIQERFYKSTYKSIYENVEQIKSLGYDAKAEDLCLDCMLKKYSSGEYDASLKDFDRQGSDAYDWDANLNQWKRKDLTEEEILTNLKKDYPDSINICFYFRLNENEPYHMVQCEESYNYLAVLNFLKGNRTFLDTYDRTVLLRDEIDLIEKMTGIALSK